MLKHLYIQNYTLIKNLEIQPAPGMNVITGETGAGKSILLGAIGLLLGNRADSKVLLNEENKCIIEGTFDLSGLDVTALFEEADIDNDSECIIRREINPTGKSRAFINDTPVNLELLKKWGALLIDIHSQHDTLLLGSENYQLNVLDSYCGIQDEVKKFKDAFKIYKAKENDLRRLQDQAAQAKKQLDYDTYIFNELENSFILEENQEVLESTLKKIENAEQIKLRLSQIVDVLHASDNSVVQRLTEIKKQAEFNAGISENLNSLKDRLLSMIAEAKDIASEYESEFDDIAPDQEKQSLIQEKLDVIYKLQTKHGVHTIEELQTIRDEAASRIMLVTNIEETLLTAEKEVKSTYADALKLAQSISKKRIDKSESLCTIIEHLLKDVGFSNAVFQIKREEMALQSYGIDQISFRFSANKGIAPQELKHAASGGEFSRLMLCIKYILAEGSALPTVIFDEIDTGISGEVAIKVAAMISKMAKKHQVITITHLPQMAAQGTRHYFVYKDHSGDKTYSSIRLLNDKERLSEIAQMIGGSNADAGAVKAAETLLKK